MPPIIAAVWFAPLAVGGMTIALVGGVVLHRLPGTILLLLAGSGFAVSTLLFALIPDHNPNYWAWVFPAMVCATLGVDVAFNVSSIFITTNIPKDQQGVAGACINMLVFLGMTFFLGWADFAVNSTSRPDAGEAGENFRPAFYLGIACGGAMILLVLGFIRIGRAKSDLTVEEKGQSQGSVVRQV